MYLVCSPQNSNQFLDIKLKVVNLSHLSYHCIIGYKGQSVGYNEVKGCRG